MVHFTPKGMLFVDSVSVDLGSKTDRTLTNVKRFLGRPLEHEHVQELKDRKVFKVIREEE